MEEKRKKDINLEEKLKVAQKNVERLQIEFNMINTLLIKWQGICEYLNSLIENKEI